MALDALFRRRFDLARHSDLVLAALVVGIVAMMIIPLPTFLLDILIATNISLAVILLLVSIYITDALRIAAFPSILLITTLFRLGLNVSSTRLILLQADAGEVIRSFGNFVVAGNLVVGVVIFLILTLIQFIVVAKGSERVAEVAARFTLDAMPGKQMAIDADVRAGSIDTDEARRMRTSLQRESQMYGSMDGAMKFVKGDAIAGILITIINIVGGLTIGVLQRDMVVADAARVYSLLTIGDGLVSQIPALLVSTAAGIVVTRVASEDEGSHLGRDIGSQIMAQPRALAISAGLLVLLAVVPGLPAVPFLVLAGIVGTIAYRLRRRDRQPVGRGAGADAGAGDSPMEGEELAPLRPIALEVGAGLAPYIALSDKGDQIIGELIPGLREMLHAELGILMPGVNVRAETAGMDPQGYRILLSEVPIAQGEVDPAALIALADAGALLGVGVSDAVPVQLPGIGQDTCRVGIRYAPALESAGVQLIDPATRMVLHLGHVLKAHAHELLGIQETQQLLEGLERTHPALVNEVIPKLLSVQSLADVLRRLVEEGISVRDLRGILETLAEWAPGERDPVVLAEHARMGLRRYISHQHTDADGRLNALLLDPAVEETIRESIQRTANGSYLALEPEIGREFVESLREQVGILRPDNMPAVVLTHMEIRRYVRRLIEVDLPNISVLSLGELMPTVQIVPLARIGAPL